jgi:hypothetical protein
MFGKLEISISLTDSASQRIYQDSWCADDVPQRTSKSEASISSHIFYRRWHLTSIIIYSFRSSHHQLTAIHTTTLKYNLCRNTVSISKCTGRRDNVKRIARQSKPDEMVADFWKGYFTTQFIYNVFFIPANQDFLTHGTRTVNSCKK